MSTQRPDLFEIYSLFQHVQTDGKAPIACPYHGLHESLLLVREVLFSRPFSELGPAFRKAVQRFEVHDQIAVIIATAFSPAEGFRHELVTQYIALIKEVVFFNF
jgi:hypothetical protein